MAMFREEWFWPSMRKMCEVESRNCEECLKYNVGRVGFHPISPVTATLPIDHVAIDFIGPLQTSEKGHNYVLLLVDIATRFVVLRPLQTKSAEVVAWTLLKMFSDFGLPKVIQHDQDKSFINEVMERFRKTAEFAPRAVMKYFPAQNGAAERYVGETKRCLLKMLRGDWSRWERMLPAIQLSMNDRVLGRHLSSPFALMYARKLNGSRDYRGTEIVRATPEELMKRNRKMVEAIYPEIEGKSREKGEEDARRVNGKRELKRLEVKTKVMKTVDVRTSKLQQRWEGPFTIVGYDEKSKGYRVVDITGALLKSAIPMAHLKVIEGEGKIENEEYAEIRRIHAHRGERMSREYLVEWKDEKEKKWVREQDFQAHDLIRKYWKEFSDKKRVELKEIVPRTVETIQLTKSGRQVKKKVIRD
jgi:hypothetical protein